MNAAWSLCYFCIVEVKGRNDCVLHGQRMCVILSALDSYVKEWREKHPNHSLAPHLFFLWRVVEFSFVSSWKENRFLTPFWIKHILLVMLFWHKCKEFPFSTIFYLSFDSQSKQSLLLEREREQKRVANRSFSYLTSNMNLTLQIGR